MIPQSNEKKKFPIKIKKGKRSGFKTITTIEILGENRNVRKDLIFVEQYYGILINSIKQINNAMKRSKDGRKVERKFYWLIGDEIINFLTRIGELGFYLSNKYQTISKHCGLSVSFLNKVVTIRKQNKIAEI